MPLTVSLYVVAAPTTFIFESTNQLSELLFLSFIFTEVIIRLMEDCQAFCCSFVDQTEEEEKNTDGDGGVAATNL